ncbi:MSCRAMM family protein [Clostridium sp. 'White wine YQ']|uniref:MSCRAMM family protein n=1 Tax=Clostridium sp. 'White wine YQ' TaxID=3027474 RepID=UPI0023673A6D|nr:carboxypeptidase-like regulatory domain-containing protein [Clostridium sp. 'White wine YQ']MDD7795515.1 carboxypeptidase-like regulatory domain-containing protein [Clostridium sp. 'White wine YQ']
MIIKDVYILTDSDSVVINENEEVTVNLDLLELPPCYDTLLIGKVVDRGAPIANATVKVFDENFNPLFHTNTDENGIFKFKNLLYPGEYEVIASANYYMTSMSRKVRIRKDEVTKIALTLKKHPSLANGIVYGKVLEEVTLKPISNAMISMKPLEEGCRVIYKTTSNSRGQYLIYNVSPNKYTIEVERNGYNSQEPIEISVEKYEYALLNLYLLKNYNDYKGTISGIITSKNSVVSDAEVFLYEIDNNGDERIVQVQVTNEDGVYLFSNIEGGDYIVKAKLQNGEYFEKNIEIPDSL